MTRMDLFSALLIVLGLVVFESVNSIDNAVINADVLGKVGPRARRWFLTWGIFFAVFVVRGLLPLLIIWLASADLSFWQSFSAMFTGDEAALKAIENSSPMLLMGAGVFLLFIFLHWLFLEPKVFGLSHEKFFLKNGVWFFATASIFLSTIVWFALKIDPMIAFGAVIGSSAFFIVNGFKDYAEKAEIEMQEGRGGHSDVSKIVYLEMIDMAFSVDGVLGAFAFTLSIPLILIGNGIGALIVRQMTVSNIDNIKKYVFLKHGAMYSVLALSIVMLGHAFGIHIPEYVSPIVTFAVIGYFFAKSRKAIKEAEIVSIAA